MRKKINFYKTIDKICAIGMVLSLIVGIWAEKGSKLLNYAVNFGFTFFILSLIFLMIWLELDGIYDEKRKNK